jgi:outer membrane protein, heavy metal efflux system
MRAKSKLVALLGIGLMGAHLPCAAQNPQTMPGMQHEQGAMAPVQPAYPRMGRAQEHPSSPALMLDEAQRLAAASNPTLRQAEAEIRAAKARQQQSALYPNPGIGYTGDEIRGGSINGGKQGFFVEQTIVTGGKLSKARDVFAKESNLAETEAEEQKLRVETAVRTAYMRVLAAQELLDARRDLANVEQQLAETQRQLLNAGQADETEVLTAELQAQRLRLAVRMQENSLREEWRALAATLGRPDLPLATVAGDLEHNWPELNEEQITERIATQSPAAHIADTSAARAEAAIISARRASIPDLQLRGGLEYNNEWLANAPHAVGWEGIAEVSAQLPIFNRNQGNVAAAVADLERAKLEKERIALTLRERAATVVDQYASAKLMAVEYREEILPRARKAYTLMFEKNQQMLASRPRVLDSQRQLYELQAEYIVALESVWTNGIALEGFLLTDGLEAPARATEVDRPIREINVPSPDRTLSPMDSMPRP